jgi:hypothetical protein
MLLTLITKPAHAGFREEVTSWIWAGMLSIAAHEMGHQYAAENVGVNVTWFVDSTGPHFTYDNMPPIKRISPQEFELQSRLAIKTRDFKRFRMLIRLADIKADYNSLSELRRRVRQEVLIAAGGFINQQRVDRALANEPDLLWRYRIVTGLCYKLLYVAFPKSLQPGGGRGDVGMMDLIGGKDVTRIALTISGLWDLAAAFKPEIAENLSLGFFIAPQGAPGLMISGTF